ncbi:HD domain-containing phosphohydrolase [Edaphobacter sp. 12200R-103]|jgi:putative nucleotidyltransferase with HDIG domain|uniref:HD domain-containing phosphohydrolase n=1 Tax=Edaphobacter sp. 12200R-103 TaxID=2703788 RepID=UPI00138D7AEE|nr:HD domain-containing phosphohydrolase [Edaphobacter sp. 12200R-103]QHS51322.1 response regulator [Edaphobacter sp. 12200R-103]
MLQEKILVVDDEEPVRGIVATLLERGGYHPVTAAGAQEAIDLLGQDPNYALVLSDIMMPGTDGLALLDRISTDHPDLPVIMFSAVRDIQVATNAFRRGAFDYLIKPFERRQLESVVARAAEHRRHLQQNIAYRQHLEEVISTRTSRLRAIMQDLERSYDITIGAMGDALDLRDQETEGHSKRVTAYTIELARSLGVGRDELRTIARGAFLHDIGKIATPDAILLKPGRLDETETAIMREHCQRGYEMLRKIPFLCDAAEIVYAHQERYDGSGYPRGLRGNQIPLGARIFTIADTLDAMTSDRPYRKGTTFATARAEIIRCSGTQFDPAIVNVYLKIPDEHWGIVRKQTEEPGYDALTTL